MNRCVAAATLLGCLALSARASAFTTRTTADGTPVRWMGAKVSVVADASLETVGPNALAVADRAFATWESVEGAEPPLVVITPGEADAIGYVEGETNYNTIRFATDGCDLAGGALGITVVTFDSDGAIVDADVVINGGNGRPFAILPDGGVGPNVLSQGYIDDYDLQNVLTHEAGHFFSLQHETEFPAATMFPTSGRGEISKRQLSSDDEAGLVAIYSPSTTPKFGGCQASPFSAPSPAGSIAVVFLALAAIASRSRKAKRAAGVVATGALLVLVLVAAPSSARASAPASAFVTVTSSVSHWEAGLLVTSLDLASDDGATTHVDVDGGHLGHLHQVVGEHDVPVAGARLTATLREGALVVAKLPHVHVSR